MQPLDQYTSICALSTPPGVSGIAVVRVSGPDAYSIVNSCFVSSSKISDSDANRVFVGNWSHEDVFLDEVTVTVFKAPKSFTGEDVCEIGCHGGFVIPDAILNSLVANGCTLATPGEFTQRAFLNGKIDLSKADAIADLIHSENPRSTSVTRRQYNNAFRDQVRVIREELFELAGLIELEMDFSEEDVEFRSRESIRISLESIEMRIAKILSHENSSRILRTGLTVGLFGHPNVGKSSLLNALIGKNRALVSDTAGTTRDYIESSVLLEGVKTTFVDTAGLRESSDVLEVAGIELGKEILASCDIVVVINDVSNGINSSNDLLAEIADYLTADQLIHVVQNKVDLLSSDEFSRIQTNYPDTCFTSTKIENGIQSLMAFVQEFIKSNTDVNASVLLNDRMIHELRAVHTVLLDVIGTIDSHPNEFLAVDLRTCVKHLNYITGDEWNENILESVFSNFCIGK